MSDMTLSWPININIQRCGKLLASILKYMQIRINITMFNHLLSVLCVHGFHGMISWCVIVCMCLCVRSR